MNQFRPKSEIVTIICLSVALGIELAVSLEQWVRRDSALWLDVLVLATFVLAVSVRTMRFVKRLTTPPPLPGSPTANPGSSPSTNPAIALTGRAR
jgi:hypothetical protein